MLHFLTILGAVTAISVWAVMTLTLIQAAKESALYGLAGLISFVLGMSVAIWIADKFS